MESFAQDVWPEDGRYGADPQHTLLKVFVFKAPSLGAMLAHDLELHTTRVSLELNVDAQRAQIQANAKLWELKVRPGILNMLEWLECRRLMRKHVLRSEKKAQASFRGLWERGGELSGEMSMLESAPGPFAAQLLDWKRSDGAWTVRVGAQFRQSDFGLEPFSNLLGVFKLRDEINIELETRLLPSR